MPTYGVERNGLIYDIECSETADVSEARLFDVVEHARRSGRDLRLPFRAQILRRPVGSLIAFNLAVNTTADYSTVVVHDEYTVTARMRVAERWERRTFPPPPVSTRHKEVKKALNDLERMKRQLLLPGINEYRSTREVEERAAHRERMRSRITLPFGQGA